MKQVQKLVFDMLQENTGEALCDSGGIGGRNWEKNQKKSFFDFKHEQEVSLDLDFYHYTNGQRVEDEEIESNEVGYTVSLFHYLPRVLELDDLCDEFNALPVKDWEGEAYGVSRRGEKWLKAHGFEYGNSWNTYNGECTLSQTIQGTELEQDGSVGEYVLIQIHNGADVRGGYTDAKLFRYGAFQEGLNPCPYVSVVVERNGEQVAQLSNGWDGRSLTDENGVSFKIKKTDTVLASID